MEGCRKFSSFDQLKTWISNKEKTDNIKLRIGDSRTIACVRKRGIIRFINEQLKYYEITYRCIHSGHRISKSSGQRPGQSTFRIGCPFFMRLSASSDGQHLVVQKFLDQHNHEHTKPLKTKMIVQSYDGELKATSCSELLSEVVCNGMLEIASEDAIEGAGDNGHNTLVLTDNLIQKCSRVTPEIRRLKRKRKYDKFVKDDPASTNSQEGGRY
ncbi:uncharacterized protein LOC124355028 isoform X1 [Homalodisca vitripennis]|uniref:uncharacterized protein LOC124355028 isoform X1 n=2 Tax=Homalodisca vitripennis TaxID=197043 RepID=UPI001EE9D1F8|nr:uncharacterized protein LOC124355028 isoform X1 [Homalodisca vitripennis]